MGQYYQRLDRARFDYQLQQLPGIPDLWFRGPPIDRSEPYIACIGAAQTFGRFCDRPYPALLAEQLDMQVANLAIGGAGPRLYLRQDLLEWLNGAALVVVQVLSARSESNALFDNSATGTLIGTRRSDGARMRFERFLEDLAAREPLEVVEATLRETQANYLASSIRLLQAIRPPKLLLWFSQREPDAAELDPAGSLGAFPHLVTGAMVEKIRAHANAFAACVSRAGLPQPLWPAAERIDGTTLKHGMLLNRYYPSPEMHAEAAGLLAPVCLDLLESSLEPTAAPAPQKAPAPSDAPEPAREIFFGLHIPKTAGTTLWQRVASCLPESAIHQRTSIRRGFRRGQRPFLELGDYGCLRFVFGHDVHEEMIKRLPRPPILFTGLREPEARLRSYLGYTRRLTASGYSAPPTEQILPGQRDAMCRFIIRRFPSFAGTEGSLAERAMGALRAFSFCYFPDTFERWAALMFQRLGIAPAQENHLIAPEPHPQIEIPDELLAQDRALYAMAREHFAALEPTAEALAPSAAVVALHGTREDTETLRAFLLRADLYEFRHWNMLDEVIQRVTDQLAEVQLRLEYLRAAQAADEMPRGRGR